MRQLYNNEFEIVSGGGGYDNGGNNTQSTKLVWDPCSPNFATSVNAAVHEAYPGISSLHWDTSSPTWQSDLYTGISTAFPKIEIVNNNQGY